MNGVNVRSAWWTFALDDWHRGAAYYAPKRTERWSHLEFRHQFERSGCPTQTTILNRGNAPRQQQSVGSVIAYTFSNTGLPLRLRRSDVWPLRIGGFPSWSSDNELSKRWDFEVHHGSRSMCRATNLQNPTGTLRIRLRSRTSSGTLHIASSVVQKLPSTTARAVIKPNFSRFYLARHTDHGICVWV